MAKKPIAPFRFRDNFLSRRSSTPPSLQVEPALEATVAETPPLAEAALDTSSPEDNGEPSLVTVTAGGRAKAPLGGIMATRGRQLLALAGWPLAWLSLLALIGGTGSLAFLWLSTLPPLPNCKSLSDLSADADRLYCAQQAAQSGKTEHLIAGLNLVKDWSADHPLHQQAQRLMTQWSRALLLQSHEKANRNDFKGAVELASAIPPASPLRKEAQGSIHDWNKQLYRGQTLYEQYQTALRNQDWRLARQQIQALAKLPDTSWQPRLEELRLRVERERLAWNQLEQIRLGVGNGTPEGLAAAIVQAQHLDSETIAWSTARTDINRWEQALLALVASRMTQQDLPGAIAVAQQVPLDTPLTPNVRDLVWFSRVQQADGFNKQIDQPIEDQVWRVALVMAAARQVQTPSPFYKQIQAYLPRLEMQLQDLLQIQAARTLAGFGQIPALQLAIHQAQQITPSRPRRLQAQTLIADWRQQIQRIEDGPILAGARQVAKTGTVKQLQAAIALASRITPGRALRLEAQGLIADWNRQIQIVEDQPILNQSRTLARQAKWEQAIQTANQIRVNRVLYREAQAAIADWEAQLQIAQDRPILDRATALAQQGSLTMAISVAEQIRSGRVLYWEAQSAISRWAAQREAILATRTVTRKTPATDDTPTGVTPPSNSANPEWSSQ